MTQSAAWGFNILMHPLAPPFSHPGPIIDAIGGTAAFARWWGVDMRRVSNWRMRGRFPADLMASMSHRLLAEKGIRAAPSAWGQRFPQRRSA